MMQRDSGGVGGHDVDVSGNYWQNDAMADH